jgi:hypothetical protein
MAHKKNLLYFLACFLCCCGMIFSVSAQDEGGLNFLKGGTVRGNTQIDAQYYPPDAGMGISEESLDGKYFGLNGFTNVIYTNNNFSAGYFCIQAQRSRYSHPVSARGLSPVGNSNQAPAPRANNPS